MHTLPVSLFVTLMVLIVISRPYLESRRPPASLLLAVGFVLGPSMTGLLPPAFLETAAPIEALAAGWLALAAAESWNLADLRRIGTFKRIAALILPAALVAVLVLLVFLAIPPAGAAAASTGLPAVLILVACAAIAVDPAAARAVFLLADRPDAPARQAPAAASFSLGCALAGAALAAGWHGGGAVGRAAAVSIIATILLGITLALTFTGLLRMAQGRGPVLGLLLALSLVGWGLAGRLGLSPLASLFIAGVILANDTARRDLVFTQIRESHLPMTCVLLVLVGAHVPLGRGEASLGRLAWMVVILALARPLAWLFAPAAGLGPRHMLALSPLALVLCIELLPAGSHTSALAGVSTAVAITFVLDEAAWYLLRRQRAPRTREAAV
ncbi:MAG: hypothetical protein ACE5HU_01575 [Acidobacteriota bacterium]